MIEKLKKKFTTLLDWIEKFTKRFRALIYLILACTIIFYVVTGRIDRNQALKTAKETAEKIIGLNFEKDILIAEKANVVFERDSLKTKNKQLIKDRDLILLEKYNQKLLTNKYRRERDEARADLKDYTPNESYDFLDNEAYPFTGEKEYGFNARQVSGIHETFVENESNKNLLASTESELNSCEEAMALSLEHESRGEEIYETYEEEVSIDSSILAIEEEKNEILTDVAKKKRRRDKLKKIWNKTEKIVIAVGSFIGGVLIAR